MTNTKGVSGQPPVNLIERTERSLTSGQAGSGKNSVPSGLPSQAGEASLSGAGSVLAAASTGDDVRTDKVAALKAAIDAGSYQVSASDVADKLIHTMLE